MIRRALPLLLVAIVAYGCGPRPAPRGTPRRPAPARPQPSPAPPEIIRVRTVVDGRAQVLALPLEEYVLASTLSEIAPPAGDPAVIRRIFEVQSIVARTYAVANRGRHTVEGFDLCDTTHCQLVDLSRPGRSRWGNAARGAVASTRGKVLYFKDTPVLALFHSDCGGARAAARDVWGGAAPAYLDGGADPLPDGGAHASWRFTIRRDPLRAALNANARTAVGDRLDTIDVQGRDPSGRARLVLLNGARAPVVRGEDFRAVMAAALGPRAIRSARFEVRREGDLFVFEGQGFGHGVGLCQRGALARADVGQSAQEILDFYYPGTRLR